MRGHLKSIAVLTVLTVAVFLAVRAITGRGPDPDQTPTAEEIDNAMARVGYRRVDPIPGWAESMVIANAVFAHCPTTEACDGDRGDRTHPTVGLTGATVIAVYLRGVVSARVCFSLQSLAPPVTDPGWLDYARAVARLSLWAGQPTGTPPDGGPSPGRSSDVGRDGWRCVPGPRPRAASPT